ncbi:MFS transporter [Propioniciclava flava]|uniref:MFS transporter n=1 Tax=Propioniciclava flava TaxID=2072026 RepID=A0A4Q2EJI9_9ACTN|nr:MFS transporter [Propioniciclava flava]RXW33353.1 MFS transporter [Propioniciclava flava]
MTSTDAPRSHPARPAAKRPFVALAILCLAELVGVMDNTIINVGIPTLGRAFDASTTQLQWIVDAYTLVFAVLMLPGGYLGDRWGRRRVLIAGLLGFAAVSLASALTTHLGVLIALRALLGICAALVFPATLSLISTIFHGTKHHALAVGLWAATAGLGIALGPVLGGLLLQSFAWPSLFAINIAIVLPVAAVTPWLVPESRGERRGKFDGWGVFLAVAALGLFVGAIIEGPQWGWTSWPILGALAASIALATLFLAWERRVASPLLDLSLFRARGVAACSSAIGVAFFSLFGFTFAITIYFQAVRGYSALQAGLAILPFAVVMAACSPLAPVLARKIGPGRCIPAGMALMSIGFLIVSFADATNPYWAVMVPAMIFMAMGLALAQGPATDIILSASPSDEIGVASGVNDSIREVGGTIGVAVLGSILTHVYREQLRAALPAGASYGQEAGESIMAAQQVAAGLPEPAAQALRMASSDAFLSALHLNCLVLTGLTLLASFLITFTFARQGAR